MCTRRAPDDPGGEMEVCFEERSLQSCCKGDDSFNLLSAEDNHIIRKQIIIFNGLFTKTLTSLKLRSLTFDPAVYKTCIPCCIETDVPSSTTNHAVPDVACYFLAMDKSQYLSDSSEVDSRIKGYCYMELVTNLAIMSARISIACES
jgi:hypothetical protein